MLFIGDIHGKVELYERIIKNTTDCSIQLGDYGFQAEHDWHLANVDYSRHRVVFGNHEYQPYVHKPHSLGNFSLDKKLGLMTIRGAVSTDKKHRTEGEDWFSGEELTPQEWEECTKAYRKFKPRIVASHDCPQIVRNYLLKQHIIADDDLLQITPNMMDLLLDKHQPKKWIFGHHHTSARMIIEGTLFICLNELETLYL